MKGLYYKSVLSNFAPVERGDFMNRYYISGIEYIIYYPEDDKVSCVELFSFKNLSPYALAVAVGYDGKSEQPEEFNFEHKCSKADLIKYLYDIEDSSGALQFRHTSKLEGYLMHEVVSPYKVRNLYQFNSENKAYQLVFDNTICAASIFEEKESAHLNVCWNPIMFRLLEKKDSPAILLASANPILFAYVFKKAQEKELKINLYIDSNAFEALMFIAYYTAKKMPEKEVAVFVDKKLTVWLKNWNPRFVMNFVSKIQKICNAHYSIKYKDDTIESLSVYQCISVEGQSFITFPNEKEYLFFFIKELIKEIASEDISYSEVL